MIQIPKGVSDGFSIKIDNEGHETPWFKRGCLLVKVGIKGNKLWERKGLNLYHTLRPKLVDSLTGY